MDGSNTQVLIVDRQTPVEIITSESCFTAVFRGDASSPSQALCGLGRSWRIIQDVPNLSLSIAKRTAKNVSCIGMKI